MALPQHLSMISKLGKHETLGRLSQAKSLGMRSGFAGGDRSGGPDFSIPKGHIVSHIGSTGMHGTYMETFPAENMGQAESIGMVSRNLHPKQFGGGES